MNSNKTKYQVQGDELKQPVRIEKIERKNSYDSGQAHRHQYNELFFFDNGEGEHMIDFTTHKIKSKSVHSVVSNKVHLVNRSKDSFGYVLFFKNDFFQSDILKSNYAFLIECESIELQPQVFAQLIDVIESIEQELEEDGMMKNEVIEAQLHLILMKLKQSVKQDSESKYSNLTDSSLYKSFYLSLEQDYKSERTVKYYADALNMSTSVLNKGLITATGKSTAKLIQERLLLESKRLLFHSSMSVKEIGFELNFTDSAHFAHFFKKYTSKTPSEYRERE